MNPLLGMTLVVMVFALLLAGLRAWRRRRPVRPEVLRKSMHMGMGLTALTFPWVFRQTWPVATLSAGFLLLLLGLRASTKTRRGPAARDFGGGQGGEAGASPERAVTAEPTPATGKRTAARRVFAETGPLLVFVLALKPHSRLARFWDEVVGRGQRVSFGDLYFPVSVGLLFHFAQGDPILYGIPMLLLTLADSASALIGEHYGRRPYSTEEGYKTVEGSLAFFLVAFLSTHVPLLLFTTTGREQCLLIGLTLGLLATLLESVGWRGLDNLLVPLGSFVLLKSYLRLETGELLLLFTGLLLLLGVLAIHHRHTTLKGSALLGSTLCCYAIWSVGGWPWLVAPLVVLVTYPWFSPRARPNLQRLHDNHAVLGVAASGLPWLVLARLSDGSDLRLPYDLSFAAQLAIIGLVRLKRARPPRSGASPFWMAVVSAWLLVFVPFLVAEGADQRAFVQMLGALPGIVLATLIFQQTQPGLDNCPNDTRRWVRQTLAALIGSATGWIVLRCL